MADVVTSTLLENGPRNFAYRFTNLSDGTGETGVTKIDGSSAGPLGVTVAGQTFYPGAHIKIRSIDYDIKAMGLRIIWDADVDADALVLSGIDHKDFREFGALQIPSALANATGKILFTTVGAILNSAYTVVIRGLKGVPQS